MSITFYRRFIRPSVDIEFPEDPLEFTQYILDMYVNTNTCTEHRTATYSSDNLVKNTKSVWVDQTSLDTAIEDPIWTINSDYLNEYCRQHNIFMISWFE